MPGTVHQTHVQLPDGTFKEDSCSKINRMQVAASSCHTAEWPWWPGETLACIRTIAPSGLTAAPQLKPATHMAVYMPHSAQAACHTLQKLDVA